MDRCQKFITKANNFYDYLYDYSKVNYINSKTKVCIICSKHGEFYKTPNNHLNGQGCPKCSGDQLSEKFKLDDATFKDNAVNIHNLYYDYSKVEYVNNKTKVCIICPNHGEFWQTPHNHLSGKGCPKCANNVRLDTASMISVANAVHGDKYDYSKTEYVNANTKVCIICPDHGEFWQTPGNHIYNRAGCPKCNTSKGELAIHRYLSELNIEYIPQHTFKDCVNLGLLPFDVYLPKYNMCIEYDGRQHFEPVTAFGGVDGHNKTKKNDAIKNAYCLNNNILLHRISYTDDIVDCLNSFMGGLYENS